MRISITAVARHAGVSAGTVSNVLNHPERVRASTRARVMAAMSELGYVRNEAARHLRAGSSRTLALIMLDAWNPFFSDIARGVEDAASAGGWTVLLANSRRDAEREASYLREFAERRVAGILVSPCTHLEGQLNSLRQAGVESVLLDANATGPETLAVSGDNFHGGRLGAVHLLELGHRRLAFAGDPDAVTNVRDRLAGMQDAIDRTRRGAALDVLPTSDLTIEAGSEIGREILAMRTFNRPTALFAASDQVAIGALHELIRGGLRVPEDISVVGYDDNGFAKQVLVPLTTVRQPAYDMGRVATEMLLGRLMSDVPRRNHRVFKPSLVVRMSSAKAP